ncbi:hypothetical protein [Thalassotalea sp. PLHSN55]|uniref:hypothetical protein n=1 Tax=Thalassotalea sp. PLHSN55 TaxID=3435888 RepID=UPI003F84B8EB
MKKYWLILSSFALYLVSYKTLSTPLIINVGISHHQQVEQQLKKITEKVSCDALANYKFTNPSRSLIESILVCQALRLGGIEPIFNFVAISNIPRLLRLVTNRHIDLMLDSVWLNLADQNKVYVSAPLIRDGEYFKGVYTNRLNIALLKAKSAKDLKNFHAVSSKHWHADWQALQRLNIATHSVPRYQFMLKMVHAKRADFLLDDFSNNDDLSHNYENIHLVPVPNMKVAIKGSRHILVNKENEHGTRIFTALQTGLKKLREQGKIVQAYQEGGFFNAQVNDWQVICCND